jgi:hypothetical protein
MSAAVAGTTSFRPTASYTTLRDVTHVGLAAHLSGTSEAPHVAGLSGSKAPTGIEPVYTALQAAA